MAKRKRDWCWRRLEEPAGERQPRVANYRRPDFMTNKRGQTVRFHAPHPTTPAAKRFFALVKVERIDGVEHVIWRGGDTFRVDDDTVTTPARFYFETMTGQKLGPGDVLRRGCKIPHCVKHKEKR